MTKLIMCPPRPDGKVWFYTGLKLRPQTTARAIIADREYIEVQHWCFDYLDKRDWWSINCQRMNRSIFSNRVYSDFSYVEREMLREDHEYVFVMDTPQAAFHFKMAWG